METHQVTFRKNFKRIALTLFVFTLPVTLYLAILITGYYKTNEYKWGDAVYKSAFYFGLVCIITIPGFLLHFNYFMQDKRTKLTLNTKYFELTDEIQIRRIYFCDIRKVENHSIAWSRRIPWKDYGYVKVQLQNGSSVIWTSLLYDLLSSKNYFVSNGVTIEQSDDFFPWLK